ncbi:CNOT6L [Cordylochernes scorpioides]|uniref:CNOT6L n=1 Tax=Cordylochernes scorpioides TaxID=51811 RepID=A0ABY6L3R5_9ARAC|nr:CNOT6L [Cordylochernes scorpioides]
MKSLRCPYTSLSQQQQCSLSWVCKAALWVHVNFLLLLSCPMKSLRCPYTSLSQQQQCPLSWVCKAAALGPCQFCAMLRPLLDMRICRNTESRPKKFEDEELQALLDEDNDQTQEQLAASLKVTRQAVSLCLYAMGKIQKEGKWLPHELSEKNNEN